MTDSHNGMRFSPIHGLHAVMTERQQYASHQFTATTNNHERKPVAKELVKRYQDRNMSIENFSFYLDKYCEDSTWITDVFGPEKVRILLDNHTS